MRGKNVREIKEVAKNVKKDAARAEAAAAEGKVAKDGDGESNYKEGWPTEKLKSDYITVNRQKNQYAYNI